MSASRELQMDSIRNPTAERCSAGQPRAAVPTWFVATTKLVLYALREIFDEAAYARFLGRHEMTSCQSAYAAFLHEQEGIKARRPKCC
jgi:hypothetical protein